MRTITDEDKKKVFDLVRRGSPIYKALRSLGINRSRFYSSMNDLEKRELKVLALLNSRYVEGGALGLWHTAQAGLNDPEFTRTYFKDE